MTSNTTKTTCMGFIVHYIYQKSGLVCCGRFCLCNVRPLAMVPVFFSPLLPIYISDTLPPHGNFSQGGGHGRCSQLSLFRHSFNTSNPLPPTLSLSSIFIHSIDQLLWWSPFNTPLFWSCSNTMSHTLSLQSHPCSAFLFLSLISLYLFSLSNIH